MVSISTLHFEYFYLSHYIRYLLHLKSLIKEVIEKLAIDSYKLKFVSSFNFYEVNNGSIVMETILRMNTNSNHIYVKYHWLRHQIG